MSDDATSMEWPPGGDPISQASLWVPNRLYKWQVNIMRDLMVQGSRIAVVTPNESGKTSTVLPAAGLSFMAAFPGAQVVSTSGVERQIREQLWPVLRASLAPYPKWTINEDLKIKAPSIRGLPPSTWEAFTTKDPNYAEGFHSRVFKDARGKRCYAPLMCIIDEAKTFSDYDMFKAFQRCDPDVWLVISTPGEDVGPFFDCFYTRKGKPWKTHEITWGDCPHLMTGRKLRDRQMEIAERGENDPIVMSWIFGKFFRAGSRLIFDRMDKVEKSMSQMTKWIRGDRVAAMDFSAGGDEQVIVVRDGNTVLDLQAFHEPDTTLLGDKFIALLRKYGVEPENTIADNGGLGKPIIDYMERKGWGGIQRYMANEQAKDQTLYVNRSAEDHFFLKHLINEEIITLPKDDVLIEQMRRRQFSAKNDDSNRIRTEPKEKIRDRGEKSPDRLDTVVMAYSRYSEPEFLRQHGPESSRLTGDRNDYLRDEEDEATALWGGTYFTR